MESIETFADFKLSSHIIKALSEMSFNKPTKVQLKTIPFCLKDKDVVVQAKTGSGKTLAFLIPIIEQLQKIKCNSSLGIQAIILVPTAELASQTINVLSKLIKYHPNITYLSVVGGKAHTSKKAEWREINGANIIVSTLGRLLEHQEKNYNLDLSNLKYLVIDETDYLLEKNFLDEMNAILHNLPKSRITWLFSATQCTDSDILERLSLTNPVFLGTETSEIMIPKNLTQTFMRIELQEKIQALWNLLEAQHNANVLVFFSTQKQVLFMYQLFSQLHPNYKLLQLRSNMRLDKRIDAVNSFAHVKKGCVLFSTDIAGRGLDFPNVSLVIQYDLPKEFDDYVHRAGRTARFNSKGVSVIMVMPSEGEFLSVLKEKGIMLKQIRGNVLKCQKQSISEKAFIKYSSDLKLYEVAKNAFLAYLRDYAKIPPRFRSFQNSKDIFVVQKLPIKKFAQSCGFRTIPVEGSELNFLGSNNADLISHDEQQFFVAKQRVESPTKKCRLEVTSDDDSSSDEEDKMDVDSKDEIHEIKPTINIEAAISEFLSTSKQDKIYFKTVIRRKYDRKRARNVKEEGIQLYQSDDENKISVNEDEPSHEPIKHRTDDIKSHKKKLKKRSKNRSQCDNE